MSSADHRQTRIFVARKRRDNGPSSNEHRCTNYMPLYKHWYGNEDKNSFILSVCNSITPSLPPVVSMKEVNPDKTPIVRMIHHPNFVKVHEIYNISGRSFVAFEPMPLSLAELAGNPFLDESCIASIIAQVLNAIEYLETQHLVHNFITCPNVLIGLDGVVKLWGQELCCLKLEGYNPENLLNLINYVVVGHDGSLSEPHLASSDWPHLIAFQKQLRLNRSIPNLRQTELLKKYTQQPNYWRRLEGPVFYSISVASRGWQMLKALDIPPVYSNT